MNVSFVILTWNSGVHIDRCLSSILDHFTDEPIGVEIFIVDNGSKDNTTTIVKKWEVRYPSVIKLIILKENFGTTCSRNLALKQTIGNFIVIIDSDVEVPSGTVNYLVTKLEKDDTIGLIAPKLLYPNGQLQKSTDRFPTVFSKLFRFFFLKFQENYEEKHQNHYCTQEVDYAISAFWVLRRKTIDKIGMLDENIFYAPEDVDFCLRIWKNGYKVVFDPSVAAIHHAQELSRGFKINKAQIEHVKGLYYYFRKHNYFFIKPSFQ